MYERFYNLAERPFELTPNPRYLFLSPRHAEALTTLEYGTRRRNGLTLLIGEAGTGKTTLVYAALERQRAESALHVFLTNPALTRDEFFDFLACGFGLSTEARTSKSRFLLELSASLAERSDAGGAAALIVDEAQCLSDVVLEEIRLLGNIETTSQKLLSIILIGQPELGDRLNATALRQLKQRVALRCTLAALDLAETTTYITTRIGVAGGDAASIFTRAAIETIYVASGGIPRTVSVICENALINGFALGQRPIGAEVIAEVCRDYAIPLPADRANAPVLQDDSGQPSASAFFGGA
jgi:type II secretory pathway predicted ATPase ExeA